MKNIRIISIVSVMILCLFTSCNKGEMFRMVVHTEADGVVFDTPKQTEVTGADGTIYYEENKIKVVSYNIRCCDDPDGNSIEERAPRLMEVLDGCKPDIIGFQEYVPAFEEPLEEHFGVEYDFKICYRAEDNYEGTPIYWRGSRLELLDSGYFWLSDTPDEESKGWDAACHRITTWAKFKVRATEEVFYYVNTHLDYTEPPQVPSAELLVEYAQTKFADAPVIMTGDFNLERNSPAYATLTRHFTDVNTSGDNTPTFTSYETLEKPTLIDYCFTAGEAIPQTYRVMNEKVDGGFVSDHYGVYAEVVI